MKRVIVVFMLLWASVAWGEHSGEVTISLDIIPNAGLGNRIDDGVRRDSVAREIGDTIAVELFLENFTDAEPIYGIVLDGGAVAVSAYVKQLDENVPDHIFNDIGRIGGTTIDDALKTIKVDKISPNIKFISLPLSVSHEKGYEPEHNLEVEGPIEIPESGFLARFEFEVLGWWNLDGFIHRIDFRWLHIHSGPTFRGSHNHNIFIGWDRKEGYNHEPVVFHTFTRNQPEPPEPPEPPRFEFSLDADSLSGNQQDTTISAGTEELVPIQIYGVGLKDITGLSLQFRYFSEQLGFAGFTTGDILPNAQIISDEEWNLLEIILISLGQASTVDSGLVGTVSFRTTSELTTTDLQLVRAERGKGEDRKEAELEPPVKVTFKVAQMVADFNGDRKINFVDFLLFAERFGTRRGHLRWDARYDLDGDGVIGFGDFTILGQKFGR